MTTEQAAVALDRLTVSFGTKTILQDLSVQFPSGGIGLLGPNGAGKSTLLKTLMGFLTPDQGTASIFGLNPAREGAEVRQMLGYMPEEEAYIPGMTAVEFVSYNGRLSGLPPNEAVLRAHQSLHYCGLGEARYRKIDTYSTGMKQRIKLAQALIHDPKLMLLDEPTNGLDPEGRKAMLDLIEDITVNKGISVILSSHLLPDVEAVCESVMVLFQGRIVASGKIDDLKQLAQRAFEVNIKGDETRFREAVQRFGGNCVMKENGLLRVTLREGLGQREIFVAARDSDVQVRRMTQEEMTLQEVFAKAIQAA
ncbi:MAG: ABC transporter ATP-binding protein [Candidatus Hinthialibacter antarcticus]|nr:ABC transporter ATP-binding protein [Candidatus Hinthialibacter antarcticus]